MKAGDPAIPDSPTSQDGDLSLHTNLLYPPGSVLNSTEVSCALSFDVFHDLGIEQIVLAFSGVTGRQKEIREIFGRLVLAPEVIQYRQEIIADLLDNSELVEQITSLLPVIDSLAAFSYHSNQARNNLDQVTWRVGELQGILDCIQGLEKVLSKAKGNLKSQALRNLWVEILNVQAHPVFQNLVKELPGLLSKLRSCASITIGVNLDTNLRPFQAALLSVNDRPFTDQSLLNRLFGVTQENEGIAELHSAPEHTLSDLGGAVDPLMVPLIADLAKVLEKAVTPMVKKLKQYAMLKRELVITLRQGLIFYLGAAQLVRTIQRAGLPMCRPVISGAEERVCQVRNAFNIQLALRLRDKGGENALASAITTNDIEIGPEGQILILTGPNQGGKTTYMVGVGILQVLAQVGCFVPGEEARISLVDKILTHFPLEEKPETDAGRFGEEALRLGKIFEQVTRRSLVLLNESLSSTSFGESLYIAQDIVRALRRVGARAIYTTHLHELAARSAELNQSVAGESQIISVVSSPVDAHPQMTSPEIKRTYKIERRPPLGQSYAMEIAARYGIQYEQLEKVLSERGALES